MSASQDYRDGAATGAAIMAHRISQFINWGVRVDGNLLDQVAYNIACEYGGGGNEKALG